MKIVIVEADQTTSNALQATLDNQKYQIKTFANGTDAWRALEAESYPIVILGMVTGMDALDLCRKIRDRQSATYTCIIMVTAKQAQDARTKALAAGADIFLTKPVAADDVAARLQIAERILVMEQGTTAKKRAA